MAFATLSNEACNFLVMYPRADVCTQPHHCVYDSTAALIHLHALVQFAKSSTSPLVSTAESP
eukprot:m.514665 g.514665  ORF g.514665 m.514665 type:complete len:62 (-) comp113929_c0_seq1:6-191(-)